MTRYAETADLTALSISAGALAGISAGDQQAALESESEYADSYLSKRFTLPLTSWGRDLKQAVCDLAAYRLMKRRGFNPEKNDAEQLRLAKKDAETWLEKVSTGKVNPMNVRDSSGQAANATTAGEADYPFVVQPQEGSDSTDDFWHGDESYPGGVGPSKRRGW